MTVELLKHYELHQKARNAPVKLSKQGSYESENRLAESAEPTKGVFPSLFTLPMRRKCRILKASLGYNYEQSSVRAGKYFIKVYQLTLSPVIGSLHTGKSVHRNINPLP